MDLPNFMQTSTAKYTVSKN